MKFFSELLSYVPCSFEKTAFRATAASGTSTSQHHTSPPSSNVGCFFISTTCGSLQPLWPQCNLIWLDPCRTPPLAVYTKTHLDPAWQGDGLVATTTFPSLSHDAKHPDLSSTRLVLVSCTKARAWFLSASSASSRIVDAEPWNASRSTG